MPKSSQDVRSEVLALRDELIDSLTMIREAIAEDRATMRAYFKRFRDFKYRPVTARDANGNATAWGQPTEVIVEPLSTQLRTTVKSLIDSIRVIESEILPEDDPEGRSSSGGSGTGNAEARARLRADFKAQTETESTALPEPTDDEEVVRTPKEEPTARDKHVEEPKSIANVATPKPWRETKPGASLDKPSKSDSDTTHQPEPTNDKTPVQVVETRKAIGLSPALRASLAGTVNESRMLAIKSKYTKQDE